MIQVFVIAPTLAVRTGLRALLDAEAELEVVAEAQSLDDPEGFPPDVDVIVLADLDFETADLESTLGEAPDTLSLLLLSDDPVAGRWIAELPLRAWGLLSRDASAEEFIAAVYAVYHGLIVLSAALDLPLFQEGDLVQEPGEVGDDLLTERESEVLAYLAEGLANKQIAAVLQISEHTVKFHVSSIYSKLGATNRAEAVRLGARLGYVAL